MKKTHVMNLALLGLLGLIWGSGYVIANYCVRHGVHPLGYAFWQSLGPAITLLIINTLRDKNQLLFCKRHLAFYFVCGLLGIALPNSTIYFTSQHLPPGIIGVMANLVPLIIYPLAILLKQEKFIWQRMIAVLIGVTGVMMIILPHSHITSAIGIPWILTILITPFSFATCALYIAQNKSTTHDALILSSGMMITSSILLSPAVFITHSFYPLRLPFQLTDWLILLEIILSTIGYILFFQLIKRSGSVYYSLVSGVVALTSVFWGWLIFNNKLSVITFTAILLILIAIGTMHAFTQRENMPSNN